MKKLKATVSISILLTVVIAACAQAQILHDAPRKKLVEFGWHSPYVYQYQSQMEKYETGVFDGVTLKLSEKIGNGYVFRVDTWAKVTDEMKREEEAIVASIKKSDVLNDNLLVLYGASEMDWFSDADWALAEDQIRFALRMARKAHCVGILWDPEPYGSNPWKYPEQEQCGTYSFEEYYGQVRKRGAQFMRLLQQAYPGLVVLSLRELSDWQDGSPFSTPFLPMKDKQVVLDTLKEAYWGLHPAFYVGMLKAIEGDTNFIDANEEAYYYTSAMEFYEIRNVLLNDAKAFIPPELWRKHTRFNRLGHAIAAEYIAGNWLGMKPFPKRLTGQGVMMTPEEKAQWLEHNTYHALRGADEYAWLYTESQNWWSGEEVPEGFQEAVLRAKRKVDANEDLGFSIEPMIQRAQDKAETFYRAETPDGEK